MNPSDAAKSLEAWFQRTKFKSPDPYAALGAFEKRFSWMPRHPRFALYKLAQPKSQENFYTSTTHSFLLKGVCAKKEARRPTGFAARVLRSRPQTPFGLPFYASGEEAGEPLAIVCLFRAGAHFDAFTRWRSEKLLRAGAEAARVAEDEFLRPDGGIAFSKRNRFAAFNVAAEGAAVFAQASALGLGKKYGVLARRCMNFTLESASGCFWLYSDASKQFDVVHNAMIYASLARARRFLGLKADAELAERFKEFCELAAPKPKNLWDYAKLLEAKFVYELPTEALWREACGLFDSGEGAFRFSFAKNVGTGEPNAFYGRHNALMYYSACLLNSRSD